MSWLLLIALLAGALLPVQTGINTELRARLGHPVLAATASMSVSVASLLACAAWLRLARPAWSSLVHVPWWCWLGGALGALYLGVSLTLAPRLGAASLISALVAGQMFASIVVDHFGLVGYRVRPADWRQLIGAALVTVGVVMMQRR